MSSTISVCMIVRDEELVLERCLKNVIQFADELIVVDTGSVDSSLAIASRYTDKLIPYSWQYDFSKARNFSYQFATMDYIMWLDADDDISQEDINKIQKLKETMPMDTDVVFMAYGGDSSDEDIFGDSILIRDRIIRRELHPLWVYPIHEAIQIQPSWKSLMCTDIKIVHRKCRENPPRRNLDIFEKKMAEGFVLNDFNRGYYCRELSTEQMDEQAIAQFQIIWEHGRKDDIDYPLFFYISSMQRLKRYQELYEILFQYNQKFGDQNMVCTILGDLCRRKEEWYASIDWYQRAMKYEVCLDDGAIYFPAYTDFLPRLGICKSYIKLGDYYHAMQVLEDAEKIHPGFVELKLLKLFFQLQKPKTISVCMIVKNEEAVLERILQPVSVFADEIIIVDTGSTDQTREIATKYTNRIYEHAWEDDFAKMRNISFQYATMDYIFWVDADNTISIEEAERIRKLKYLLKKEQSVNMDYDSPENGGTIVFHRMMRRGDERQWEGVVHERYPMKEPILYVPIKIGHTGFGKGGYRRNVKLFPKLTDRELRENCWLTVQCAIDCTLALEQQKAEYYYSLLKEWEYSVEEKVPPLLTAANIFQHEKRYQDAIICYEIIIDSIEKEGNISDNFNRDSYVIVCMKAAKCEGKLGHWQDASRLNEKAAKIDPENIEIKLNRLWIQKHCSEEVECGTEGNNSNCICHS